MLSTLEYPEKTLGSSSGRLNRCERAFSFGHNSHLLVSCLKVAEAERKTTGNVSVLGKEDLWRQVVCTDRKRVDRYKDSDENLSSFRSRVEVERTNFHIPM